MQHNNLPETNSPGFHWQILGELKLPMDPETAAGALSTWLTELLAPLNLHADFLNKILESAQAATTHGFQAEGGLKFEHIHLIILVPQERELKGRNWGFFRVEKIEDTQEDNIAPDHSIEFYLYLEGG